MTIVLDAGALVAVDRGDRLLYTLIQAERLAGRTPVTHGGVIGQLLNHVAGTTGFNADPAPMGTLRSRDLRLRRADGARRGVLLRHINLCGKGTL